MDMRTSLLAGALVVAMSAPALAFQCPSVISEIDQALASAELTEEERAQVQALRDEGEQLHNEGEHQAALDTLAQAQAMLE